MVSISEVILNRYLQKYNKDMINGLHDNPYCPDIFGYKIPPCNSECHNCYKQNSNEFTQKTAIDGNIIRHMLERLCDDYDIEYKPTEELIKVKAGE